MTRIALWKKRFGSHDSREVAVLVKLFLGRTQFFKSNNLPFIRILFPWSRDIVWPVTSTHRIFALSPADTHLVWRIWRTRNCTRKQEIVVSFYRQRSGGRYAVCRREVCLVTVGRGGGGVRTHCRRAIVGETIIRSCRTFCANQYSPSVCAVGDKRPSYALVFSNCPVFFRRCLPEIHGWASCPVSIF